MAVDMKSGTKLKYAMVCASNQNRSMEAHAMLKKNGFTVSSFGVGNQVKLPGPRQKEPNVYSFGTPYQQMYEDLLKKDRELYTRNGLLRMLKRNMDVKLAPEKWQHNMEPFDVVVTFEERVMDQVVEDLHSRASPLLHPVLVVNLDVKDSHEEAALAAPQALRLCQMIEAADEWESEVESIIDRFETETGRRPIYTICWY